MKKWRAESLLKIYDISLSHVAHKMHRCIEDEVDVFVRAKTHHLGHEPWWTPYWRYWVCSCTPRSPRAAPFEWEARRWWRRHPSRLSRRRRPWDCRSSGRSHCSTRRCRLVAPSWSVWHTSGLSCCLHRRTTRGRPVSSL